MAFKSIDFQTLDGVAWLTLNRPEQGNLVDARLAAEVSEACDTVNATPDIKAVVVTGAGGAFCRGAENETVYPVAMSLAKLTRPVIAAVNGDAVGQGVEIVLAADIRLASETARFALSQAVLRGFPADGASQRLPRIVGRAKALELLLTGVEIDAAEACRIGLVSRVHPADELMPAATELAAEISHRAPVAMRFTREAVYQGLDMTLEQGLRLEADLYSLLQTTADRTEGITAFLEKRQPRFEGK